MAEFILLCCLLCLSRDGFLSDSEMTYIYLYLLCDSQFFRVHCPAFSLLYSPVVTSLVSSISKVLSRFRYGCVSVCWRTNHCDCAARDKVGDLMISGEDNDIKGGGYKLEGNIQKILDLMV